MFGCRVAFDTQTTHQSRTIELDHGQLRCKQRTIGQCFDSHQSALVYGEVLKTNSITEDVVSGWLEKVVKWSSVSEAYVIQQSLRDLDPLRVFLTDLHNVLCQVADVDFLLKRIPSLGHLLGQLCGNKVLLKHRDTYCLLMKCILKFRGDNPQTSAGMKAKKWALSQFRRTVSCVGYGDRSSDKAKTGHTASDVNRKCIQLVVESVRTYLRSPSRRWSSLTQCHYPCPVKTPLPSHALSLASSLHELSMCLPLVEEMLVYLSRRESLTKDELGFIEKICKTQMEGGREGCSFALSYRARVAMWNMYLPSFEQEIVDLVKNVCQGEISQEHLMCHLSTRLLPKACAENMNLWRVAAQILTSYLRQTVPTSLVNLYVTFCEQVRQEVGRQACFSVIQLYRWEHRQLVSLLNCKGPDICIVIDKIGHVLSQVEDGQYFPAWCHLIQFPQVYHQLVHKIVEEKLKVSELDFFVLCFYHKPRSRKECEVWFSNWQLSKISTVETESTTFASLVAGLLQNSTVCPVVKRILAEAVAMYTTMSSSGKEIDMLVTAVKAAGLADTVAVFMRQHGAVCDCKCNEHRIASFLACLQM